MECFGTCCSMSICIYIQIGACSWNHAHTSFMSDCVVLVHTLLPHFPHGYMDESTTLQASEKLWRKLCECQRDKLLFTGTSSAAVLDLQKELCTERVFTDLAAQRWHHTFISILYYLSSDCGISRTLLGVTKWQEQGSSCDNGCKLAKSKLVHEGNSLFTFYLCEE